VTVKTADQQAAVLLHRGRERLVRQRTGLVNALRGHLAEFGVIAPQGLRMQATSLLASASACHDAVVKDLSCKLEHWPRGRARCCSPARPRGKVGKHRWWRFCSPMLELAAPLSSMMTCSHFRGAGASVASVASVASAFATLSSRRIQEHADWYSDQAYWHYSKNALDAGALDAELRAILRNVSRARRDRVRARHEGGVRKPIGRPYVGRSGPDFSVLLTGDPSAAASHPF
jgi:hypothetical protein